MRLEYENTREGSRAILTDFESVSCKGLLRREGYYKIIWAMAPLTNMRVDGYDYAMKANQVLFCTPINYIDLPELEACHDTYAFVFNREFYYNPDHDSEVSCYGLLFYGSSQPVTIALDHRAQKRFHDIFDIFKEELEYVDSSQGEMLRAMLKRLLIKSTRLAKKDLVVPNLAQSQVDVIREFNVLLEMHFRKLHQVKDYAELMCKSPKTLSNLFRKYKYHTPLTAINQRILLEARRLLLFSNKSAAEVAFTLGYKDSGHFSKLFKKHVGESPIEFKKRALKK